MSMDGDLYVLDRATSLKEGSVVERRVCCPKCGAGADSISIEERVGLYSCFTGRVHNDGTISTEACDRSSGQRWTVCNACGHRSKSQSLKVWSEVIQ